MPEDEEEEEVGDVREDTLDSEEDIYSEKGAEDLLEDEDEIDDIDEGFMKGYNEGEKVAVCANCKKVLEGGVVEEDVDDETLRFCSTECATAYEEKRLEKF